MLNRVLCNPLIRVRIVVVVVAVGYAMLFKFGYAGETDAAHHRIAADDFSPT